MPNQMFATKPLRVVLDEASENEGSLKRALGPTDLIALGVGAIIGAGIFVLTGQAAATTAGPAIVVSFVLSGVICAFAGLCYAEFASLIPVAGSAYTYGYATLGELFAWIIGWDLILEYAFGAAAVASGWSSYFASFLDDLGLHIPGKWLATPGTQVVFYKGHWTELSALRDAVQTIAVLPHQTAVGNLVAFIVVGIVTTILVLGVREAANINTAIVVVKVGIVLVFIGIAGVYMLRHPQIAYANWHPFVPSNTGKFGEFGLSGVARGAAVIFFADIGFDAVSTAAQEARNPQKHMPIGIIGSLVVCTILYILVSGLLTGLVSYRTLNVADPVAVGIDATGIRWGSILVKGGAIAGLGSVMIVQLLGQSRVFYSMSRDGLLPGWASHIHPRFRTPWISSIVVGSCVATFASLIPIGDLAVLVNIGTLLAFVIVCAGVWILRLKRPELPRPFKTPFVPLVPVLGILTSLGAMASLPLKTWYRLLIWLSVGLLIYFFYGRHHSTLKLSETDRQLD